MTIPLPTPTAQVAKPPYYVASRAETAAIEPTRYSIVSTFSGAGGSCYGFRLAGYRVLYASEFVDAAAATYAANYPETPLDRRDIRDVSGAEILATIGRERGDVDVLEGSPPCASFSTAGKRSAGWGQVKTYSDTAQRVDDLFFEYARLVDEIRPRVLVAENVSGLVKGVAKGYFLRILAALRAPGYAVEARLLDAQWLGVPQARSRIIFVGVREDLVERYGVRPAFPTPLRYRYSIRDALPEIARVEIAGPGFRPDWQTSDRPSPAILAGGNASYKQSPYTLVEVVEGAGSARPSEQRRHSVDEPSPTVLSHGRAHTTSELTLGGYAVGAEYDKLRPGQTSDRYLNLSRPDASVTHSTERRKFTIAELRRICGFPDDFILTGTYAQQWERLGRAVPPPMMRAVAATIRDEILRRIEHGDD